MHSQNWYERASNCLNKLKEKTFPHLCWTIFDTSLEQLLRQSDYEKMIRRPITWGMIMVEPSERSVIMGRASWTRTIEQRFWLRCV